MSTYPKRTTDLAVGDVVCLYGARHRVTEVVSVKPDQRYTAVQLRWTTIYRTSETESRDACLDNCTVSVEVPAGHKVVAVPNDLIESLQKMREEAYDEVHKDDDHWTELACGQDTEEAEESGRLVGYAEGLDAALKLLKGEQVNV